MAVVIVKDLWSRFQMTKNAQYNQQNKRYHDCTALSLDPTTRLAGSYQTPLVIS